VLVIRIEFGYTTEDLDLQVGGVDYAVIMKTVRSILNDSCNTSIVMVVANTAAETLAQLEYHGRKCVMLLKYFPSKRAAWAGCLNVKCMATIKKDMIRCSSCLGPRYCSEECEEDVFDAHKDDCRIDLRYKSTYDISNSSLGVYAENLDKTYNDFKKYMKRQECFESFFYFETCAFCGNKAHHICSKCKGVRYCSLECTTNDKQHLQECNRRLCVIDATVQTIIGVKPLAHDKGGYLLKMGLESFYLYTEAKGFKEKGSGDYIDVTCWQKCKEACKIRETEATLWLELDDEVGAFKALSTAGMYAMELWDCSKALSYFKRALKIAQDMPVKKRTSDSFVQMHHSLLVATNAARHKVKNTFLNVFLEKYPLGIS
jgi:hypothetical protein